MRPHYAYYVQQLQLLGWHDRRERWSLKSPAHLFWVEELVEALPESRLVMLHRDPDQVVASFCSLTTTLAGTNARTVDRTALGAFWVETWADGVTRPEQARTGSSPIGYFDLRYADLVADRSTAVRRVYAAFDLPFTEEFAAAISQHALLSPQHGAAYTATPSTTSDCPGPVREVFAADGAERWR